MEIIILLLAIATIWSIYQISQHSKTIDTLREKIYFLEKHIKEDGVRIKNKAEPKAETEKNSISIKQTPSRQVPAKTDSTQVPKSVAATAGKNSLPPSDINTAFSHSSSANQYSFWSNLARSFAENWTGILGTISVILGLGYLVVYGLIKFDPFIKFLILAGCSVLFYSLSLFFIRKEKWRKLGSWLQFAAGAIFLLSSLTSGYIENLSWIQNKFFALFFFVTALGVNAWFAIANRHELESAFHAVICFAAVVIIEQSFFLFCVMSAFTLILYFTHLKQAFPWKSFSFSIVYFAYLLFWKSKVDLNAFYNILSLVIISAMAFFILFHDFFASKKNIDVTNLEKSVLSEKAMVRLGILFRVVTWVFAGIVLSQYSSGLGLRTVILFVLAFLLFVMARISLQKRNLWYYYTDVLIAEFIFILAVFGLSRFEFSFMQVGYLVAWQLGISMLIFLYIKDEWLFRCFRILHYLSVAIVIVLFGSSLLLQGQKPDTEVYVFAGFHLVLQIVLYLRQTTAENPMVLNNFLKPDLGKKHRDDIPWGLLTAAHSLILALTLHNFTSEKILLLAFFIIFALLLIYANTLVRAFILPAVAFSVLLATQLWLLVNLGQLTETIKAVYFFILFIVFLVTGSGWRSLKNLQERNYNSVYLLLIHLLALLNFIFLQNIYTFEHLRWLYAPAVLLFCLYYFFLSFRQRSEITKPEETNLSPYHHGVNLILLLIYFVIQTLFLEDHKLVSFAYWQAEHSGELISSILLLAGLLYLPSVIKNSVIGVFFWGRLLQKYFSVYIVFVFIISVFQHWPKEFYSAAITVLAIVMLLLSTIRRSLSNDSFAQQSSMLMVATIVYMLGLIVCSHYYLFASGSPNWLPGLITCGSSVLFLLFAMLKFQALEDPAEKKDMSDHSTFIFIAKNKESYLLYPLAIGMAIYFYAIFEREALTLFWVAESFILFCMSIFLRREHFRFVSMIALMFCMIRLIFFDLASVNTITKAILFIGVGLLMLLMNVLYIKFKSRFGDMK